MVWIIRKVDNRNTGAVSLDQVVADLPHSSHSRDQLAGQGASLVEVLAETTLASSRREARELLSRGAIRVNGVPADADRRLGLADLLGDRTLLLRRGKKHWHATRWE